MSESSQVDMTQARGMYRVFTKMVLLGIGVVVVLLILMAFFLL